jgi:hypothetical protein
MLRQSLNSSVAVLMALGLSTSAVAPLLILEQPAAAQIFSEGRRFARVSAGTSVLVEEIDGRKIVLKPDETLAATLVTREPVRSEAGTVLIPRGTKVEGEFQPEGDGTQFVARRIILRDGTERSIDARTNVVNTRKDVEKGVNGDPIWKGALVGGAASAIISSVVSRPGVFKTLLGAGVGAAAGYFIAGRKKTEVVVIRPEEESLTLTFDSDLNLNRS